MCGTWWKQETGDRDRTEECGTWWKQETGDRDSTEEMGKQPLFGTCDASEPGQNAWTNKLRLPVTDRVGAGSRDSAGAAGEIGKQRRVGM
jgi:hypothetical protein